MLGALVNAVFLVALCFSITVESLKRFYEPEDIHDPQERCTGLISHGDTIIMAWVTENPFHNFL